MINSSNQPTESRNQVKSATAYTVGAQTAKFLDTYKQLNTVWQMCFEALAEMVGEDQANNDFEKSFNANFQALQGDIMNFAEQSITEGLNIGNGNEI